MSWNIVMSSIVTAVFVAAVIAYVLFCDYRMYCDLTEEERGKIKLTTYSRMLYEKARMRDEKKMIERKESNVT